MTKYSLFSIHPSFVSCCLGENCPLLARSSKEQWGTDASSYLEALDASCYLHRFNLQYRLNLWLFHKVFKLHITTNLEKLIKKYSRLFTQSVHVESVTKNLCKQLCMFAFAVIAVGYSVSNNVSMVIIVRQVIPWDQRLVIPSCIRLNNKHTPTCSTDVLILFIFKQPPSLPLSDILLSRKIHFSVSQIGFYWFDKK